MLTTENNLFKCVFVSDQFPPLNLSRSHCYRIKSNFRSPASPLLCALQPLYISWTQYVLFHSLHFHAQWFSPSCMAFPRIIRVASQLARAHLWKMSFSHLKVSQGVSIAPRVKPTFFNKANTPCAWTGVSSLGCHCPRCHCSWPIPRDLLMDPLPEAILPLVFQFKPMCPAGSAGQTKCHFLRQVFQDPSRGSHFFITFDVVVPVCFKCMSSLAEWERGSAHPCHMVSTPSGLICSLLCSWPWQEFECAAYIHREALTCSVPDILWGMVRDAKIE